MSSQPPTHDGDSRLVQILDQYLADRAAGTAPSVDELADRHPEFASELRDCLASLEMIKAAAIKEPPPPPGPDVPAGEGEARTGLLGDYRILREVGRGGMGVVYEAWQISLGRRVALKVLPFAATLDNRHLQRFKNEAQAAAQLHHSHIVPVFAVGVERGVHYYAMQFIDGRTLAAVIDELRQGPDPDPLAVTKLGGDDPQRTGPYLLQPPTAPSTLSARAQTSTERSNQSRSFFRSAAQMIQQAAEALDHAHNLGVVHRDVKPANLLVDTRGHLWVTDFGLAQFQRDANLTVTGDLVGTLRYMSPEQAQAKRVVIDHRTDIYSLGATLYELLTLRPVFDGADRAALLNQILNEDPVTPRRHNRSLPLELELITLKALAKNPEERYATAQDFADDLRRYLEDKPILARRPGLAQYVAKWARRHQAVVAAGVGFVVLALGATTVSTVLVWRERDEARVQRDEAKTQRLRAETEMKEADRQRDYAEHQRKLALQALEELFADTNPTSPVTDTLHRDFLIKSRDFFREETMRPGDDDDTRRERATAFRRLGDIKAQLGGESPERDYRESVRLLDELVRQRPDNSQFRFELVSSQLKLGNLLRKHGKTEEADKVLEAARHLSHQLAAANPFRDAHVLLYDRCCHATLADKTPHAEGMPLAAASSPAAPLQARMGFEGSPYASNYAPTYSHAASFKDKPGNMAKASTRDEIARKLLDQALFEKTVLAEPSRVLNGLMSAEAETTKRDTANLARPEAQDAKADRDRAANPALPVNATWAGYTSASRNPFVPYPNASSADEDASVARLRNADVESGIAINVLIDRVQRRLGKPASGPAVVLDPRIVRGLSLSSTQPKVGPLLRAARGGALPFPRSLQDEKLSDARRRIGDNVRQSLGNQDKQTALDGEARQELRQDLDALNSELRKQIPELPPADYIEAKRFLGDLESVVKAIDKGEVGQEPMQILLKDGSLTVVGFVQFLSERRLRVGPATAGNEGSYVALFQVLASYEAALPAEK